MHLDEQTVAPAGGGGQRHGRHQTGLTGGVAGIHDHGQVGQLMEKGHGGEIQGAAHAAGKGADAPLAEDDVFIAAGEDVFGAEEQLLHRGGRASFQKNGLMAAPQGAQKVVVLHIAGAHLQNIDVLKQGEVGGAHDLGHHRQTRFPPRLAQKLQPLFPQAREVIGGGAGLVGAAPQELRAGVFDAARHGQKLLLGLHGAGAGHHAETAAADGGLAHLHHRVRRMGAAGGQGQRIRRGEDAFHHGQGRKKTAVHPLRAAGEQPDGAAFAGFTGHGKPQLLQIGQKLRFLSGRRVFFQHKDHGVLPPIFYMKKRTGKARAQLVKKASQSLPPAGGKKFKLFSRTTCA